MTRTHARTPMGERAVDAVPKNWGDNVTVTAALTLDGIVAPMWLHGASFLLRSLGRLHRHEQPASPRRRHLCFSYGRRSDRRRCDVNR
mgnify:CR=1 FL=1